MRSWKDVHRLADEGVSGREIARRLGMSRNTVRRLLALPEPPQYRRSTAPLLAPFQEAIARLLEDDPRMPATVMRGHLNAMGYHGGLTILRQYLAKQRSDPVHGRPASLPVDQRGCLPSSPVAAVGDRGAAACPPPGAPGEPGMNMISSDYEIIFVNRTNERLFRKPMVEMIGKKCYREFLRRETACPDCPGAVALATGDPQHWDSYGIRDDGTRYAVRLIAYPIADPSGKPLGFVEVEEDHTEEKRHETVAAVFKDLRKALTVSRDLRTSLRQAINAAFALEGVDIGCAYLLDPDSGQHKTVVQRGASRDFIASLLKDGQARAKKAAHSSSGPPQDGAVPPPAAPLAVLIVPIVHNSRTVATLLFGSTTYARFPAATDAAVERLGELIEDHIAGVRGQEAQEQARRQMAAFLDALPMGLVFLDARDNLVVWNSTAEEILGRKMRQRVAALEDDGPTEDVRTRTVSLPDLFGYGPGRLVIAEKIEADAPLGR